MENTTCASCKKEYSKNDENEIHCITCHMKLLAYAKTKTQATITLLRSILLIIFGSALHALYFEWRNPTRIINLQTPVASPWMIVGNKIKMGDGNIFLVKSFDGETATLTKERQ